MSKRVLLLTGICIVLLLSFALACCCPIAIPWGGNNGNNNDNNTDAKTSSIKGTCYITTNEGTTPVAKIDVRIGDRETTTDENGYFEVTDIAAGTYDVQVAGGDLGWYDTVTVKEGEALDLGDISLHATLPLP